jgi:hypothetical protein
VRRVVEQVAASFAHNDAGLLDRLTSGDYTFVTPTGGAQTKAQRLAPMRPGELHYDSARYDEIVVRVYGTTALATARVVVQARMGTADASGHVPRDAGYVPDPRPLVGGLALERARAVSGCIAADLCR